jgi:hypothetical protein
MSFMNNTCESLSAIYLHMLNGTHDCMEVYEQSLPLHIQQGKYSIYIVEEILEVKKTWFMVI